MTGPKGEHAPVNESDLRRDLAAVGVKPGMTLTVHSSLSAIGWVEGGAQAVVHALFGVLGDSGTLAMPAATPHCADPASRRDIPVRDALINSVRKHLPVFDAQRTPTTMGAIAEAFRTWPGTIRSNHPLESVCANGPQASDITKDHPLAFSEGPGTPFARLCDLGSWVLLLGVGFNRCTALHYAETLVEKRRTTTVRFSVLTDGRKEWVEVPNVADDNGRHFPIIGAEFVAAKKAKCGSIGRAKSTLFPMRDLVERAVKYFENAL